MNILIVYAHPEPTSFCGALKDTAASVLEEAGCSVVISDLYAARFDPVASRDDFLTVSNQQRFHYQTEQLYAAEENSFNAHITQEQKRFKTADLVIFIFPLWWGGAPAILKGWIDRVLACGFAYIDGARFATGLYPEKHGLLCVSTGGTQDRFSEEGVYGPIEKVLWPFQHLTFEYMGMTALKPFVAYASPRVTDREREQYLIEWKKTLLQAVRD